MGDDPTSHGSVEDLDGDDPTSEVTETASPNRNSSWAAAILRRTSSAFQSIRHDTEADTEIYEYSSLRPIKATAPAGVGISSRQNSVTAAGAPRTGSSIQTSGSHPTGEGSVRSSPGEAMVRHRSTVTFREFGDSFRVNMGPLIPESPLNSGHTQEAEHAGRLNVRRDTDGTEDNTYMTMTQCDVSTYNHDRGLGDLLSQFQSKFDFRHRYSLKNQQEYTSMSRMVENHVAFHKINLRRAHTSFGSYFQFLLYRELVLYFAYVVLYFYIVFGVIPVTLSYEAAAYFSAPDANMNLQSAFSSSTFSGVNNIDDIWVFINNTMIPLAQKESIQMYFEQIGAIRLRQIRVKPTPCVDFLVSPGLSCYPAFSFNNIETSSFQGDSSGTWYNYGEGDFPYPILTSSWSFIRDFGYTSSYGEGGFIFDFSRNTTRAAEQLEVLGSDRWLNVSTRALSIQANYFNRHSNLFVVTRLLVEFSVTGYLVTNARLYPVRLVDEGFANVWPLTTILFICLVIFIYQMLKDLSRVGPKSFFLTPMTYFEIVSLGFFIAQTVFLVIYVTQCSDLINSLRPISKMNQYIQFLSVAYTARIIREIGGVTILIFSFRTFKYLSLNRRLTLVWTTLRLAALDLAYFIGIFLILFVGFGLMGYMVFGTDMEAYHSFTASFRNLFAFISGSFDSDAMNDASPVAGAVFFYIFIILVTLILLNVFIAIIGENYEVACANLSKAEHEEKMSEESGYNWLWLYKLISLQLNVVPEDDYTRFVQTGQTMAIWMKKYHQPVGQRCSVPFEGGAPDHELIAQGEDVYKNFLLANLAIGDNLRLISNRKRRTDFEMKVSLRVKKVWVTRDGITLECVCLNKGATHAWQCLRPSYWTTALFLFRAFLWPGRQRLQRSNEYFKHYEIDPPQMPLSLEKVRDTVAELIERHEHYDSKVAKARAKKPNPLNFDPNMILTEVMRMERNFPDLDPARIMAFIEEASKLDSLLTKLRLQGGVRGIVSQCLGVDREPEPCPSQDVFKTFKEAMGRLNILERQLNEIYISHTQLAPPPDSLRFDQLLWEVRLRQRRPMTVLQLKKQALKIWFSFPFNCFDLINEDLERTRYVPQPVNLSGVIKSSDDPVVTLGEMIETLAEVLHDNWSLSKVKQGWRYGPNRDDANLVHPLLVPFQDLSLSEKAYDLDSCYASLRLMVYYGYDIVPPAEGHASQLLPIDNQEMFAARLPAGYVMHEVPTHQVEISQELFELADLLGRNAHEIWAAKRRMDGWTWGPVTDDRLKVHSLLQPFEMLDDESKASNISSCMQIIKTILAFGCKIQLSSHIFGFHPYHDDTW